MAYSPTTWVAPGADGRLEVFVVGSDHDGGQSLWHRWQTTSGNGWSDWCSHGTPPDANGLRWSPTVAPAADGCLEVFVVGDDLQPDGLGSGGALHRTSQTARNGGWSRWRSYPTGGPNLFGSPAVVRSADGHLELFVLGDDGALWHMWQTAPNERLVPVGLAWRTPRASPEFRAVGCCRGRRTPGRVHREPGSGAVAHREDGCQRWLV